MKVIRLKVVKLNLFQSIAIYFILLISIAIFYFFGFKWFTSYWSLIGVYINIKKIKWCFIIWAFTNFAWAVIDFKNGLPEQGTLFSVYFILAIYGLWQWHKEGKYVSNDNDSSAE